MKKTTALLLCLIMALALIGCGAQEAKGNDITALFDQGYTPSLTTCDETSWVGVFQKDGGWDCVYLASAAMTAKQYADYSAIGYEEEDCEAKQKKILAQLADVKVTDITDQIPTQEDLDAYIGKTMGDLENEGYEKTGYIGDAGMGYEFYYEGPEFALTVIPENSESMEHIDNYSENDLRGMKIGSVTFTGFSFNFIE